ncbi:hypothetical protein FKM82_007636 [Ascaphus truei]
MGLVSFRRSQPVDVNIGLLCSSHYTYKCHFLWFCKCCYFTLLRLGSWNIAGLLHLSFVTLLLWANSPIRPDCFPMRCSPLRVK